MNYQQAQQLFSKCRNPQAGKLLENNTRLFKRGDDYAVQLHQTDVVTIHRSGLYTLNSGGWRTVTTKARMNEYGPTYITQTKGVWYLRDHFLYFDGITLDELGNPIKSHRPDTISYEKARRKVDKMVRDYIKGFCVHLEAEGHLTPPDGGDCWLCGIFETQAPKTNVTHFLNHFKENYFVPSLLWNAMQRRGDPSVCWKMLDYDLQQGRGNKWTLDSVKWDLRGYFRPLKPALTELILNKEKVAA